MSYRFKLPDIGEGVAEGEILKWAVKEGESIKEDQPLVEVMTDKVNVQIPSPKGGTVSKILAKEGDVVKVGQEIVVIEVEGGETQEGAKKQAWEPPSRAASPAQALQQPTPMERVLATPATRKLARDRGVEITKVKGTGPGGRITDDDVRGASSVPRARVELGKTVAAGSGNEERVPLRGIRKTVAERMVKSSQTVAAVTHVDEADMTELVLLREAFKGSAEKRGIRLTFLPLIIKAVIPALKEFPYVNSTVDDRGGEIVLKRYYNFGIATDTDQGLMVPVVKDADLKDVFELAAEIERLSGRARSGQLDLEEVRGSTFTLTNAGSVGGLFATPIVNYPEVAIMGIHRIVKRPTVRDGRIEARDMMYLSLTFDHRVFDGAYAARFVNRVIEMVQDPKSLLKEML